MVQITIDLIKMISNWCLAVSVHIRSMLCDSFLKLPTCFPNVSSATIATLYEVDQIGRVTVKFLSQFYREVVTVIYHIGIVDVLASFATCFITF